MNGTDQELLQRYARERADDAFAELVRRHLNLVYSAALRQVRSPHLAEEVAQSVFLDLARQATRLKPGTVLAAWLYQVTRRTAIDVVRREARRQSREQTAVELNAMNSTPADWNLIGPLLDDALETLDETDRTAILLRFFENKSFREVGAALGASDDAAQKRVTRAVDQLRDYFGRRGVTVAGGALVALVSANAVQAAPAGLVLTVSGAVTAASAAVPAAQVVAATKTLAMTTLQKTLVATTLAIAIGAGLYETGRIIHLQTGMRSLQSQARSLNEQVEQLRRERDDALKRLARAGAKAAPRLPAPRFQAAVPAGSDSSTNLYQRLKNSRPGLTAAQVAPYLQAGKRNAASLLAAYRTTGDAALLAEAMQKFPEDPHVAFEAALRQDRAPEERRQWLDALKKTDTENSFGNYLSALDYFKSGQTDLAVQEMLSAAGKPFQDYSTERYQDDTEAYLAAGYSVADAKTTSGTGLLLPQLTEMKQLGQDLVALANSYTQSGDSASAQAVLQMALNLGQCYSTPSPGEATISQLVGIYIERAALEAMGVTAPYGSTGQTVQDRLDELARLRTELIQRSQQAETIFPQLTDQDWVIYRDRWQMFGEENAIRWLVSKYGQQ